MASALRIDNLKFFYKEQYVLDGLNLTIEKGEIYGLVGKARSGKTTIVNLILGLLRLPEKSIYIQGEDYVDKRRDILSITGHIVDIPYYQNFFTPWQNLKYLDTEFRLGDERIAEVLRLIGLTGVKNKKVKTLTVEQQKRVSIGMALFHDPDLLIFDDLFKGIPVKSRIQIHRLLNKLRRQGKTILISARKVKDVECVCSRVGVLDEGRMIIEGSLDYIKDSILHGSDLVLDPTGIRFSGRSRLRDSLLCQ